jgi:hypothetical protein
MCWNALNSMKPLKVPLRYFVVVKYQSKDRAAVQALVRTLEKALQGQD